MPSVLIADEISEVAVQAFAERGIEVGVHPGLAPEALAEIIGDYEGLVVRSATRVTPALLERADRLKVVGRAGTGVDNVDMDAATKRGIVVMNTPHGNSVTAAEHTVAMMCALARRIPQADRSTRKGGWERGRFMGVELRDKTLGVIGCGTIGAIVATLAQGLRMRVVTYDPYLAPERASSLGVTLVTMDELLADADVITLHVPLTDETRGTIDAEALAKTRPGVRIVNCARGGLIVEADLKSAIDSGHVAGAALDVFEEEPARDNPLFALDEVIATPHLGASTVEAQENVAHQIAQQMAEYLLTGTVLNAVNTPSVSPEEMAKLGPYLTLAPADRQLRRPDCRRPHPRRDGLLRRPGQRARFAAAHGGRPAGPARAAPRRHQYRERPLHRPRARYRRARGQERDDGRLSDPHARRSADAGARAGRGRHAHRPRRAADR